MRVLERQPLPANAGEADGDDRVAALLLDADDHPLAPARVPNARAHAKRQIVAERLAEGRVRLAHDPAARLRPRVERRQVLLRHLAQEARRLAHAISVDTPVQRARERLYLTYALHRRRSEEHTSELQSRLHLVCRLLLENKTK